MTGTDSWKSRLRFFGREDCGTFFQLEDACYLLRSFDSTRSDYNVNDVVELYHLVQFAECDLFPAAVADEERDTLKKKLPELHRVISKFFACVDDSSFAAVIKDIDPQYRADVLRLLAQKRTYDRCTAQVVLAALQSAEVHITDILTCSELVCSYDQEIRTLLLESPNNAEHLIAKHLRSDTHQKITFPPSLSSQDNRSLIKAYVESSSPNPNFLRLVADARDDPTIGIDASLRLMARHAYDAFWAKHFEVDEGILAGCEIRILDEQTDAVMVTRDELVVKYSYSRDWLLDSLDYPTVLNNFIYLFGFSDKHMLLNFPSFRAELGIVERYVSITGKDCYQTGMWFKTKNEAATGQTAMYEQFLRSQDVELEAVLAWFFTEYIADEFGAKNFRFVASSPTATFLERSRHLFSEMDGVIKQFTLYVQHGRLDPELLRMTSKTLPYGKIPSLVQKKYLYATEAPDIQRIQHLLFSDQSLMGYVREDLHEDTLERLIINHDVLYDEFTDLQKANLDFLVICGVINDDSSRPLSFASLPQFRVLKRLNDFEAVSFFHYSPTTRDLLEDMERKGWVEHRNSLLTIAESKYFNFMLNQSEFSNGPDLRNRYSHGSQPDGDDNRIHYQTYIQALRLLVALVIKINDDFEIGCEQNPTAFKQAE